MSIKLPCGTCRLNLYISCFNFALLFSNFAKFFRRSILNFCFFFRLYLLYTLNLLVTFLYFYRQGTMNGECNVEMTGFCEAAREGIQIYEFVFQKQGLV